MFFSKKLPKPYLLAGIALMITVLSNTWAGALDASRIIIDGSSTVYPISQAAVKAYEDEGNPPINFEVSFSGTSGGFRKFCDGQTDITGASRPITTGEIEQCFNNQIPFIELPVAFDALTVIVNPQNNWVSTMTTAELRKIWEPAAEGKITRWNQIRPNFPDEPINLFGAGSDSGTFDYFTEAIMGQRGSIRSDFFGTEDDNEIVQRVAGDKNALGFVGFSYYEASQDKLRAVAIDNGKGQGPILPSAGTVVSAAYQPLSRPLFLYVNFYSAQQNPNLREFIDFFLSEEAIPIVASTGYIPLTDESYKINLVTFHNGEVGTVFGGQAVFDLTLPELQRRQAEYGTEASQ